MLNTGQLNTSVMTVIGNTSTMPSSFSAEALKSWVSQGQFIGILCVLPLGDKDEIK